MGYLEAGLTATMVLSGVFPNAPLQYGNSGTLIAVDYYAGNGEGACDAPRIFQPDGGTIDFPQKSSHGRIFYNSEGSIVAMSPSNSTDSLRILSNKGEDDWKSYYAKAPLGKRILFNTAVQFIDNKSILFGTREDDGIDWIQNLPTSQFYLTLGLLPDGEHESTVDIQALSEIPIQGTPIGIFPGQEKNQYYVVRTERMQSGGSKKDFYQAGNVWIDIVEVDRSNNSLAVKETLETLPVNITFEYSEANPERFLNVAQAGNSLYLSGGVENVIQVIDMTTEKASRKISVEGVDLKGIIGIAYNEINGLFALHARDKIVIGKIENGEFITLSWVEIGEPGLSYLSHNGAITWTREGNILAGVDGRKMKGVNPAVDIVVVNVKNGLIGGGFRVMTACSSEVNGLSDVRELPVTQELPEPTQTSQPTPTVPEPTPTSKPTREPQKPRGVFLPIAFQKG